MNTNTEDLEPIDPGTAQKLFLDHKATDCTDSTVQNHRYRLNPCVRWCGEEGIENLNELSGRDLQHYRLWRKEDGDLNKLSLRMQMSTIRVRKRQNVMRHSMLRVLNRFSIICRSTNMPPPNTQYSHSYGRLVSELDPHERLMWTISF